MTNFLFSLDHSLLQNRVEIDALLLVTTKGKKGSAWANGELKFQISANCIEKLECAIGEEENCEAGTKFLVS